MDNKPDLYFRRRINDAAVFRLDTGQTGRIEMTQIAIVKANGDIKPSGKHAPTTLEEHEITGWYKTEQSREADRRAAQLDTLVKDINAVAQWVQADATDAQALKSAKELLMPLHDLRSTIVKRISRNN